MDRTELSTQESPPLPLSATKLSPGQKLLIYRRREGLTQAEAAEHIGMPESSYCCAELDQAHHGWTILSPLLGRLREYEKCLIFRLRRGMSQQEVADAIGRSRYWLGKMERGEVTWTTLARYWSSRMVRLA